MDLTPISNFLMKNDLDEITVLFKKGISFLLVEQHVFPEYDSIKPNIESLYHFLIPRMKPELKYGLGFHKDNMNVTFERFNRDKDSIVYALKFHSTTDKPGNSFKVTPVDDDNSEALLRMGLGNTVEASV